MIPWHRRSSVNSLLIVASILSGGLFPGVMFVCLFVLTGDIYSNNYDANGNLKTWGWGNKVAAIILLILNVISLLSKLGSSFWSG
jgi:hypothetical protein